MQQAPDRFPTDLLHNAALHRFAREQANGPAGSTLGRRFAGHSQDGDGLPGVQRLTPTTWTRGFIQSLLEAARLKLPFDAIDGHERDVQDLGKAGRRRPLVQRGQDLGSLDDPNRRLAFLQQLMQLFSFRRVERHPLGADMSRSHTYKKQFSPVSYLDRDAGGLVGVGQNGARRGPFGQLKRLLFWG